MTPGEWDAFAAGIGLGGLIIVLGYGALRIISRAISDYKYTKIKAQEELDFVRRQQLKQEIREEISRELGLDEDVEDEIVLPEEMTGPDWEDLPDGSTRHPA